MNNNNKKSAEVWANRLFKQSSLVQKPAQVKTYFAHRYHNDQSLQGQSPFSALFSNEHKDELNKEAMSSGFVDETGLSTRDFGTANIDQAAKPTGLIASTNENYPDISTSLSAKFTVLNCYDETLDTKTFRLGRHDGRAFEYLPGQYITLSVVIEGRQYKRSYSLASSPCHQGILEITVKRDPNGGKVSNWLNNNLTIGDTLNIKGPYGKFSCAKDTPGKILFLAAGSGIVPIMSMLRWLADTELQVDVMLLLSFRNLYDIIYGEELNLIAAHHNNIKLFITLTKEPSDITQWPDLTGRVNRNLIAALVPDLQERAVYLCGPDTFMADCKYYLQGLKLPDEQLFCESFTVNSPVGQESTISEPSSLQYRPIRSSRNKTGSYQIRFAKSERTITADGSTTLLELAEEVGINLDHECRAGSCGECMVKCLKGRVDMTEQAEIGDLDREKGWVYACCAYPASDAVLDV